MQPSKRNFGAPFSGVMLKGVYTQCGGELLSFLRRI